MLLYKYKNLESQKSYKNAIDSLQNKYLYFSRPSELNDPFDCQIQFDFDASDKEYLQWIKDNRNRIIANNRLKTVDGIKQLIKEERVLDGFKDMGKYLVEKNHLLSLTTDCMNESMWALYAGNYNGICIGYKPNFPYSFMPTHIEFSNETETINLNITNQIINFQPIKYDNLGNHPLQIFKDRNSQIENVTYILMHKKKCWETEKEFRAIFQYNDFKLENYGIFTTKVFYEDSFLEEVIFGYQIPNETIEDVKQTVEKQYSNDIKFYVVKPDLRKFELIKVPIKQALRAAPEPAEGGMIQTR